MRRRQLLDVGLDVFEGRPYDEISLDDVAQAAGVSHGLVYYYFRDKRQLYIAVLETVIEHLVSTTAPRLHTPPLQQLYEGIAAHVDFAARYRLAYTSVIHGGNGGDDEIQQLLERAHWRALQHIFDALGIDHPSADLRVALRGWNGFTQAAIIEWLRRDGMSRDELIALIARSLAAILGLVGVAPPPPAE